MRHRPTAAALAVLLITAGIAGVISAEPNGTASQPNATTVDAAAASDVPLAEASFEERLADRLARFDLTDAQIREIVTGARRLHDDGASRLVIRSSIVMNLYEFGVDAPFLYADGGDDRPPGAHERLHRYTKRLDVTPDQARELHTMVHRMYEAGATRAEIHQAIDRQLATWDEAADRADNVDRLVDVLIERYDLDREQAAELAWLVRRMADHGADRDQIRAAIGRLLEPDETDTSGTDAARAATARAGAR